MNIKNFEYLKDQVFYCGFGNSLENPLKEMLSQGEASFNLEYRSGDQYEEMLAILNFSKSKQNDMYFFNSYTLELKVKASQERTSHRFYMNGTDRFTLKEAYNLLHGRAVLKNMTSKEGESYRAWVQMDLKEIQINGNYKFKKFYENYGFDLFKELQKYPIIELEYEDSRTFLLESLARGNRQMVTFNLQQGQSKMLLEVSPQYKNVLIFDQQNIRREFQSSTPEGLTDPIQDEEPGDQQIPEKGLLEDPMEDPAENPKKRRRRNSL